MKTIMNKTTDKEIDFSSDIVNLVIARLEAMPRNIEISIGSGGDYTISQLIESVKQQDEIGTEMIKVQMNYLKSLQKNYG